VKRSIASPHLHFRFIRSDGARPLVWAHRGARAHAPENTLAAFERGRIDGADGIELDVRTTRDGVVVVLHDLDLKRVTDGRDLRLAASMTATELLAVEHGEGARAPTLADVLDWADAHRMLVNVELKHDVVDRWSLVRGVARLLRGRRRVAERVLLSSFEPRLLAMSRVLMPAVPRAFLVHEKQRLMQMPAAAALAAQGLGAIALNPERTMCSPSTVTALRGSGLLLNVWTVNDPNEARDLALLGVDGLITDDPAALLASL
jgi:glycerophosphoryl diester phosphodiesterase